MLNLGNNAREKIKPVIVNGHQPVTYRVGIMGPNVSYVFSPRLVLLIESNTMSMFAVRFAFCFLSHLIEVSSEKFVYRMAETVQGLQHMP